MQDIIDSAMMTTQEILDKLDPIFQEVFNDSDLAVDLDLTSDDIDDWSSLSQTLLLTEIESAFDIRFKLREIATMNSVRNIVAIIESKLQ